MQLDSQEITSQTKLKSTTLEDLEKKLVFKPIPCILSFMIEHSQKLV